MRQKLNSPLAQSSLDTHSIIGYVNKRAIAYLQWAIQPTEWLKRTEMASKDDDL